ncbi:MAG: hypothetical protein ACD_43C00009G0013 [uncultured bacterium]|nr:MAG: hypothetical protein ACD_43C00009G0013 [uncultured bacterium]
MQIYLDTQVEKFIQQLTKPTIAKVLRMLDLLERFEYRLGMPHSKRVDHNIFELRIRGQQEVRIFYTFHNTTIILFYGFIKKSNSIPKHELKTLYEKFAALDII